jgi:hypothetical protein
MHCNAGSHPGIMPAWYQTSERHMILATITLSVDSDAEVWWGSPPWPAGYR